MENFKIKSRYLKLCYELRVFIRCTTIAFNRPNYQKFLMCPLIKRLGRASETLSRAFKTVGRTFETLGRAFEGLR